MSPRITLSAPTTTVQTVRRGLATHLTDRHTLVALAALIVVVGAGLRLVGNNWDGGAHLHPDERYISTISDNIDWPRSPLEYLDVDASPLSPFNIGKGQDYIYGLLPLFAGKLAATAFGQERYGELNLFGRRLAALIDTLTIVLVFLIARSLLTEVGRRRAVQGALLAASLYAFTVTAIQHAHFFTTDAWLVFFGTLTFLLALRALRSGVEAGSKSPSPVLLLVGASLGLTVACKVSGLLVVLPVGLALLGRTALIAAWAGRTGALLRLIVEAGVVLLTAYVSFRLVSPYTFSSSSWLDVSVNDSFRAALTRQADATSGASLFPPAYQWLLTPRVWGPLENLVVWQLGIPLGIAALVGLAVLLVQAVRKARSRLRGRWEPDAVAALTGQLMLLTFVLAVFLSVATRFAHTGRYLLPIVPFLAVAAAYGLAVLTREHRRIWIGLSSALVVLTALYAVSFTTIYTRENTRIAASAWLARHVPTDDVIANEHWDDPLPVGGPWLDPETGRGLPGAHRGILIPVFDPDDAHKLRKLYNALSEADYYVLSSPRAWNTIGRLPDRFPLMARFYAQLFAGRLGFEARREFTSYPGLFGVHLDDLRAEEAFWVYDHPPVKIFRRTGPLDWQTFKAALCPAREEPHCP